MQYSTASRTSSPAADTRPPVGAGIGLALALIVVAWFSIVPFVRPQPAPESAPANEFSAARAIQHIQIIAQQPHPVGSQANATVRDYLLQTLRAQGLTPEIQDTVVTRTFRTRPPVTERVQNIIARIPGSGGDQQSVALVAHYDSVTRGPGASDDGAGVAALLETVRALRSGPPLVHDVLLVITDGEERGLLGAKGFVDESPLVRDVGLVLNFEARGTTGPAYMFESSDNNGWLIPQFARGATYPVGYSFTFEIYKLLPNNTDFTEFREAGIQGLNFAFLDGFENYHTANDDLAHVDPRSVQHHGEHMLSLARHFGTVALVTTPTPNVVYFALPGPFIVYYPQSLVLPLAIVVTLLFGVLLWQGLRRARLTRRGVLLGFGTALLSLVLAIGGTFLIVALLPLIHSGPLKLPEQGATYNSKLYAIGLVAFAVSCVALLVLWLQRRTSWESLTVGAWVWWLIVTLLTSFLLPGASYLFSLPLLCGCLALTLIFVRGERLTPLLREGLLLIPAVVALLLCGPLIQGLFIALMIDLYLAVMLFVALLLVFLLPQLRIVARSLSWALPIVAMLIAINLWIFAALTAGV